MNDPTPRPDRLHDYHFDLPALLAHLARQRARDPFAEAFAARERELAARYGEAPALIGPQDGWREPDVLGDEDDWYIDLVDAARLQIWFNTGVCA